MLGAARWLVELFLCFWMVYGVVAACEREVILGPVQLRGRRATVFGLTVAAASIGSVYVVDWLFGK
jgi:hypothetical protein